MVDVLLVSSQAHRDFRTAELNALCQLFTLTPEFAATDDRSPLIRAKFDTLEGVKKLLSRSMLLKRAYEVLAEAHTYDELADKMRTAGENGVRNRIEAYNRADSSWAIRVECHGKKRNWDYVSRILERFAPLIDLDNAPIDLKAPRLSLVLLEDHCGRGSIDVPSKVYLCRLVRELKTWSFSVGEGQGRLKTVYDLKRRVYIGNSTMDPELAFIQSNLTHCRSGALALDPFCGTGGLMLPAAHHGCLVLGTEISWQVVRAVGRSARAGEAMLTAEHSIRANFKQYNLEGRFLGVVLADSSQHRLWRENNGLGDSGLFDCIISDPPYGMASSFDVWYGIRSRRNPSLHSRSKGEGTSVGRGRICVYTFFATGQSDYSEPMTTGGKPTHYPEKKKYSISDVYLDLLNLAAKLLVIGGRVSLWFPVMRETYSHDLLPTHPGLQLTHNCEQPLTRLTSRRLLVYVKIKLPRSVAVGATTAFYPRNGYVDKTFREMVFNKHGSAE